MAEQVLDFVRTRRLLLLVGLITVAITVGAMASRGVDSVEVWATILFFGVFMGAVLWGVLGGLASAVAAIAVYFILRAPAIELVGFDQLRGTLIARSAAYLIFGIATGWASGVVLRSLVKLDKHDVVDDATGLLNARGTAEVLASESARARRYGGVFSIVTARVHFAGDRRERRHALESLGDHLRFSLRSIDRVGRWEDDNHGDVLIVILPETPRAGAAFVHDRIHQFLLDPERDVTNEPTVQTFGWPDDADAIKEVERLANRIMRSQHPESASDE